MWLKTLETYRSAHTLVHVTVTECLRQSVVPAVNSALETVSSPALGVSFFPAWHNHPRPTLHLASSGQILVLHVRQCVFFFFFFLLFFSSCVLREIQCASSKSLTQSERLTALLLESAHLEAETHSWIPNKSDVFPDFREPSSA